MSPPPKSFDAECPQCGKVAKHEEFFRERRAARSEMAARRGDYTMVQEWSFRCTACGARHEKALDTHDVLHKWQGNRHVTMHVGE